VDHFVAINGQSNSRQHPQKDDEFLEADGKDARMVNALLIEELAAAYFDAEDRCE